MRAEIREIVFVLERTVAFFVHSDLSTPYWTLIIAYETPVARYLGGHLPSRRYDQVGWVLL